MVFGQSSLPIWLLGTIEFIWAGWIPLNPHHKIIPLQNYLFRDPKITPKTSPGQNVDLGVPKSDPGLQNPSPGMKKQKMRAEKPCRTPSSDLKMEPYGASYGHKPFGGKPSQTRLSQATSWEAELCTSQSDFCELLSDHSRTGATRDWATR